MSTYGPFYSTSVTGDGWTGLEKAQGEPNCDYASAQGTAPELLAGGFKANIPTDKRVKGILVGILAQCISVPPTNLCLDSIQLQSSGTTDIGDPQLHGAGVGGLSSWTEAMVDGIDLDPAIVNSDNFVARIAFYDQNGFGTDGETRVSGIRIMVEAE